MIIEKLNGNLFSPISVLEMDIVAEAICLIDGDVTEAVKSESIVNTIESAITSGPHWQLNPACQIFVKDGKFNYKKEILIDDIIKNGEVIISKLDIHRNIVHVLYPVRLILMNAKTLSDDLILKSELHIIHTPLGTITL